MSFDAAQRRDADSSQRGHRKRRLAFARTMVAAFLTLGVVGCNDSLPSSAFADACRAVGLCDEPLPPPVLVDVLCDASASSSCTKETLGRTLDAGLRFLAEKPGSQLRLWTLGPDVATTEIVAEQVVPTFGHGGERAQRAAHERFVVAARDRLLASAGHVFKSPPIKKSPIAAALTKIGLAETTGLQRSVIAVTDGREVSDLCDLECKRIPSEDAFLASLRRSRILGPELFDGARIELVFVEGAPIARGCAVSVDREVRVRGLWVAALTAAGATSVRVTTGSPLFTDLEPSTPTRK